MGYTRARLAVLPPPGPGCLIRVMRQVHEHRPRTDLPAPPAAPRTRANTHSSGYQAETAGDVGRRAGDARGPSVSSSRIRGIDRHRRLVLLVDQVREPAPGLPRGPSMNTSFGRRSQIRRRRAARRRANGAARGTSTGPRASTWSTRRRAGRAPSKRMLGVLHRRVLLDGSLGHERLLEQRRPLIVKPLPVRVADRRASWRQWPSTL